MEHLDPKSMAIGVARSECEGIETIPPYASPGFGAALSLAARRFWWVVLLSLAVGALSTAIFVGRQSPVYEVKTNLVIGPNANLDDPREIADSLDTLDRRTVVATLALLPASRLVRTAAEAELGAKPAAMDEYAVTTAVVPDSNVIEITVTGNDPQSIAAFANALADQTVSRTSGYYPIFQTQLLDRATAPTQAVGVSNSRKIAGGVLFSFLIGLGSAVIIAYMTIWLGTARSRREAHEAHAPGDVVLDISPYLNDIDERSSNATKAQAG